MSAGQAGVPAAGKTNRVIFQQFPRPIRQLYGAAVVERSLAARHAKLCKLGEAALAYLASMALSDYRNRRHMDPDPKTESLLARMKRLSMGQYLQIFRVATDAIQPALFDYKLSRPDTCVAISRFFSAYSAIEDAIELEAQNLRRIVSQRLQAPAWATWLGFWEKLVEYRNRAEAHPATYNWPIAHADYYAIMSPLLEEALVEALTAAHVERVFSDHPVATLTTISHGAGRYLHEVAGEDLGLPFQSVISLDRSVCDIWSQESWRASPGCQVMLAKLPSGAYEISGLMHDLVAAGPPRSLAAGTPDEPRTVVASTRSTSPWRTSTRTAAGTCGELVQGFTAQGVPFHVTCPIAKTATVTVTVRPAPEFTITQIDPGLGKLAQALRQASNLLELEPLEIRVEHCWDSRATPPRPQPRAAPGARPVQTTGTCASSTWPWPGKTRSPAWPPPSRSTPIMTAADGAASVTPNSSAPGSRSPRRSGAACPYRCSPGTTSHPRRTAPPGSGHPSTAGCGRPPRRRRSSSSHPTRRTRTPWTGSSTSHHGGHSCYATA
jgi:hypothetical protein